MKVELIVESSKRKCAFCAEVLGPKGSPHEKAKEHVLRNKLLKRLGHEKTPVHLIRTDSSNSVVDERKPVADAIQAGDVCRACNNGWMNDLDVKVEDLIFDLARNRRELKTLTIQERIDLSWWMLKTACTTALADSPSRRHIPLYIYAAAREQKVFPARTVVVGSIFPECPCITAMYVNDWLHIRPQHIALEELKNIPNFKVGIQYESFIIGVAHFDSPDHDINLHGIVHQEVIAKSSGLVHIIPAEPERLYQIKRVIPPRIENFQNSFLFNITTIHRQTFGYFGSDVLTIHDSNI